MALDQKTGSPIEALTIDGSEEEHTHGSETIRMKAAGMEAANGVPTAKAQGHAGHVAPQKRVPRQTWGHLARRYAR